MDLSPTFFELQFLFAESIVRVSHLNFEEALLDFTNLYMQFPIDRSFDPTHPVWQAYLTGLRQAPERAMWTYTFYQHKRELHSPYPYGCFHYSYLPEENTIRYHFANADMSGSGPLSKERMPVRLQELKMMFAKIKKQYGDIPTVRGNSWLYNIDAYRRLFPVQYTQAMKVVDGEFQYMSLWGQFLQRDGRVHRHLADAFLSCLQKSKTIEGLASCFPYQVLSPQSPIALFYEFYEV
ncbi:hypothetical protein KSD_59170 [Ktedonobacter sp. SOSP1-85]|uniref:hypothetical protein n=1 Tax=Ktedonobacter sp. SOSP1-85 TaxID=2778367 RepID=UPI0019157488|nr:hypothetical protein [Ktedonobacter sp. SOSP1-85]GHO78146.1 hypothetical protein KSD_59170 [Ktedonobacter sp. SOSP1-85]